MSSYRSSTTAFSATIAGAYDLLEGQHHAVLATMCSTDVLALARDVASIRDPRSDAVWARVDAALPRWAVELPTPARGMLDAARSGDVALPAALRDVAIDLAVLERRAVAEASVSALTHLGYAVQRADGAHTSAVEARRGHETLLVRIGDQGRIETDHILLGDETCNDRQSDFVEAMRERGVLFDEEVTVQHHDPRGGSLVADAARAGGGSLAVGAVLDGDARPSAFTTTLSETRTAAPMRVTDGGAR